MGDSARSKRREQLKRWAGSCTDKASDVPRRRWRGDGAEDGAREPWAEFQEPPREQRAAGRDENWPLLKRRKWVSGETQEAHRGGPSDAYGRQREQGAFLYKGLHRRQHGDGVLPPGARRQCQPGGQRGLDTATRHLLLQLPRHRRPPPATRGVAHSREL